MLRLAWRNVWRNFRRSLITTLSMGCGLAAIMFGQSMMKSEQAQLVIKATQSITGHIQIQARGVADPKFPNKDIDRPEAVERALAEEPGIAAYARRLNFTGLVSSPETSFTALVVSVQPKEESRITNMASYLISGRYLGGQNPHEIIMGDQLAKKLDLRLGDKAVIMAQSEDGSLGAAALRLIGIYHTGSETFDGQIVYIPLKAGQEITGSGDKINHFVVKLNDLGQVDRIRDSLAGRLSGLPVKVLTWKDIDHELVGIERFQNALLNIVLLVIFIIVSLGILNTLLMSLFERVREFGVLMAIGAKPGWVLSLVLLESLCLGAVGTVFGLAMGSGIIAYFGRTGLKLPLGDALSYFLPFPSVIYLHFYWAKHLLASLIVFVTSTLAAIPPALRAGRLKPAEALRHV